MSKFILFIVLIYIALGYSQDIPSTSTGALQFYLDACAFKGKEGKTYQEFYLMIHADELNFKGIETKNAEFKVISEIKNQNGDIISQKDWLTNVLLNRDSKDLRILAAYDQWAELLNPGNYNISVQVIEMDDSASGISDMEFTVPAFNEDIMIASNIEFVSNVHQKNEESQFEKNNRVVTPNPWRRYGILIPKLTFYYEIYNLSISNEDDFLRIDYTIMNKDSVLIKRLSDVKVKKSDKNVSIIHAIDLTGLNSGIYTLKAVVIDDNTNSECIASGNFEIIQADYFTKTTTMSEEEIKISEKLIEYVGNTEQFKIFSSLSSAGKTQFIINFWKNSDPSPGTDKNEFFESIMNRYNFSNQNFGWGKMKGYESDRGRVLIKYGMPDETENFHSEADSRPYEIWKYSQDRSFIFVFGDINSNGKFVLLHSTKDGEVANYNWKDYLKSY